MSKQYPAGIISKTAIVPTGPYQTGSASGIWTMDQQAYWSKQGLWPIAGNYEKDNYFNYVTMLLHGDGTNGAQNSTFLDSSPNNYTVTLTNTVSQGSFSPYGANWSNYFDGSSFLDTSTTTQIIPTGSFTVECWVYVTSTSNQAFVAQGTTGNAGRFSICIEGGLWFAQIGSASINIGTPVANTWNYLAVTFNGSTLTLYVNGTSIGTASTTTSAQNTSLTIGTLGTNWQTTGYYVTGYISNVRVSNVVRTITTPTAPYTSDANTRLLACNSNRFIDSSGNYVFYIQSVALSVQRFSPFAPTAAYSSSTTGGSGRFDGTSGWLRIQSSGGTAIGTSDFTLEFWFYPLNGSVTQIEYRPPSSNGAYITLGIIAGSTIELTVNNAARISAGFGPPTNAWSHIAISRVSGSTRLFVNGVQAGSTWADSTNYAAANGNLWWNAFIGVRPCQGYISGYRLATTGLYSSTFTPPSTPPTAITNTQQLLNFTNAGIVDSSANFDLRTVGNAAITTSTYKYGTGSISFDGSAYLYSRALPNPNVAFGTGDFTVEAWINTNTLTGEKGFIQTSATAGGLQTSYTNGVIAVVVAGAGSYTISVNIGGTTITGSVAITTGTWYHIAFTRSSGSVRLFINGVLAGGPTTITANLDGQYICIGGYYSTSYLWNGYIDDLRITKGVARYTATFTPPEKAFIDF